MVEFRVLGAVDLRGEGGAELRAVLSQPKRVALLAYLGAASPRGFHRRDALLALFWPELDQDRARAALRQALHGLRRSLGDGAIEGRGTEEIRLDTGSVRCDAVAFDDAVDERRHADAVELYGGELLAGFFISGAVEFEQWLDLERARLRRRAVEAAWALAGECNAAGNASLAAHWARHAAALVRDDEEALRRLIGLLSDLGDRAGALQAYDAFARRLSDEYEAEPAADTRALIASVRSRESIVTSAAPAVANASHPSASRERPESESAPVAAAAASPAPDLRQEMAPRPRPRTPLATVAALITVVTVTLTAALVWGRDTSSLAPTRVVVARFSNRTGDTSLNALGQLARDEIARGLALTEVVELADPGIAARNIAGGATPAAGPEGVAAAARTLSIATGSGLAVLGAYYRRGPTIEFAASVVDQRAGRILRILEPVRGDPADPRAALTTLRDQIMVVAAEAVDPRLGASASAAAGPPRYEAYAEFITGVGIWYDGRNGRDALPHFTRAIALDSTFALPLIWSAWVHQTFGQCDSTEAIAARLGALRLSRLEQIQIDRQMARCRGDLESAYRLGHVLADARPQSEVWQEQLARDALNFHRPREASLILERLHPDEGALRGRASYYNWLTNARHLLGEHDVELEVALRGRARFPGNLAMWRTELLALSALGRGDEVVTRLDEIDALATDPLRRKPTVLREIALDIAAHGNVTAGRLALMRTLQWHVAQPAVDRATDANRFELAQAYHAIGHLDSARAITEALVSSNPEAEQFVGLLGVVAARRGDIAGADAIAARLARMSRHYSRGAATYWRACIAAEQGRRDDAVAMLRRALAEGYVFNGLFFLSAHLEPSFARLRGHPPFDELMRPRG